MRLSLFLLGPLVMCLAGCGGSSTPPKTTPAAPPDFSLSVTPSSQTLVQGTTGTALSLQATATNGFASPVTVDISGLPASVTASPASLTLTPGSAQNVTLTAGATAATGASTVMFSGTASALSHTAALALTVQIPPIPDVTTYHFDNSRDGLNAQETALTPANVTSASFGKVGLFPADGKVDAQPLYLAGLNVNGTATNVLYMATEHGSLYAFNADTGAQLWKISLLGSGEAPSGDHGCNQISPEIGITSTPVIDRAKGAIYAVAMSKDASSKYHQRLHALSLTTGAELAGSPVEISGTYPGTGAGSSGGMVPFTPGQYAERAGLLLLNGTIYLAWTSHCDYAPYTGWVMAYSESTLQQTAILNLTPNGSDGSIWMSGNGLAADASGNIYFLDANGTLDTSFDANGFPAQQDYGNAIMKLSTAGGKLAVADYFEPFDTALDSMNDVDLGSGGAMLLPDLTDASGTVRHLLVGAGKDTNIYVADRDNLGKFNSQSNSNMYQELPGALAHGAWSSPAYFNGTVYYGGWNNALKAFPITQAKLATTPSSQSAVVFPYPGSTPSVSANGTQNAIVWALESPPGGAGVLHAYDATSLSNELYNSNQAASGRDSFTGNKFITPVIVNGKVFVGTPTGVAEFGLLP
jgi:outer membrane protein assembly factor BamB